METSLERLVQERQFAGILQTHAEVFFRLSNSLLSQSGSWNKKHYFQLINEADSLESFLDDFGARANRTYALFRELVAAVRWFAHSGYSITHLVGRLESYGTQTWNDREIGEAGFTEIREGLEFLRKTCVVLLEAIRAEAQRLGLEITPEAFPDKNFLPVTARRRLPRNIGQDDLVDEEQKIAEVATKYLQAAEMIAGTGISQLKEADDRHRLFRRMCTEELARVYEATIHNLQSTYDTHVQNTVLEAEDDRLPQLRGHTSAVLHLLESVTYLAHFIERHESEVRSEDVRQELSELVDRSEVERVTLNTFLFWAHRILQSGAALAEDLLPEYTNIQELVVDLPDSISLHARPAALIVGIVNHYGTPVEMELNGHRCNAGSILELLVAVGSQPDQRRFLFRGDERPLLDIGLLYQEGLGEAGLDSLPEQLSYLQSGN